MNNECTQYFPYSEASRVGFYLMELGPLLLLLIASASGSYHGILKSREFYVLLCSDRSIIYSNSSCHRHILVFFALYGTSWPLKWYNFRLSTFALGI